ncbi:FAD-binding oxidoreductase [Arthrobacter celericrescens]|uniref:FAD-binding oxidoreductase n=1 Tax=Arthrobacter celericrescens TaxID=2320851 RepID=UPI000EA3C133|nr:FAD-linked oxidase C-terminal domain-containing protein [Arthrobacter celericrescens]
MSLTFNDWLESGNLPASSWSTSTRDLATYAIDRAPVTDYHEPLAVLWPENIEQVQLIVRAAAASGTPIVARGAGTSVSGGAHATKGCVVLSLERMNRILDINVEDETAVVEPGVINADLGRAVAAYGLMYAPDPASYEISTIGGNVATNAGGLRCAKYGVTRDSVLALDVVLADGTLINTGHKTFKGVAGYDLTGLFVGSEGTLGIVVGITVRLRYLPQDTETIAAFFPDFPSAARGVLAVGKARVQPAIMELLDRATLEVLDKAHGTSLTSIGNALLLIQTDGRASVEEAVVIKAELSKLGAAIDSLSAGYAERLLHLRRHSRGDEIDDEFRVGEDIAVPRSRLVDYVGALEGLAQKHQVHLKVVAHAGDGNLHPTFWVEPEEASEGVARLEAALDESVDIALAMSGTITGEHGIGQYKLQWLPRELSVESLDLQRRIKEVFDPQGLLNPGKAILSAESTHQVRHAKQVTALS